MNTGTNNLMPGTALAKQHVPAREYLLTSVVYVNSYYSKNYQHYSPDSCTGIDTLFPSKRENAVPVKVRPAFNLLFIFTQKQPPHIYFFALSRKTIRIKTSALYLSRLCCALTGRLAGTKARCTSGQISIRTEINFYTYGNIFLSV
ncbi:MAG: hypothetical protein LBT78_07445 [Tannerella sp.]|jgi:hypothetical protein|nr:hypothetical protein [Tannerella sp.]